ncbi:MAG: class I SAM-dependent methyltransferase, partial [Candidatus Binataceae bacterium]
PNHNRVREIWRHRWRGHALPAVVLACALVALGFTSCASLKKFAYEGFGRDSDQQPARVIAELGIKPGERVADLGAGGGYFTWKLADAVGPTGKVYAVDIDTEMTGYLQATAQQRGYRNVKTIVASPDDPKLPAHGVDLLFTCNTYHHIENRAAYFARVKQYLAPDGRVAIIDYRADAGILPGWFQHSTEKDVIEREMTAAGYKLEQKYEFLAEQSFIVFAPLGAHPS